MHNSNRLIVAATLGSALLICAGEFSPADARSGAAALSQCISANNRCWRACADVPLPSFYRYCLNRCWSNHAVCVDRAFEAVASDGASTGKPPKAGTGAAPPPGGILQSSPGFPPQGPAPTGQPKTQIIR